MIAAAKLLSLARTFSFTWSFWLLSLRSQLVKATKNVLTSGSAFVRSKSVNIFVKLAVPIGAIEQHTHRTNATPTSLNHSLSLVKVAEEAVLKLTRTQEDLIFVARVLIRLINILLLFTPVIISLPLLLVGQRPLWYNILCQAVEHCGATAIKLGQWMSSRRDLFPLDLCDAFVKLQRNVQPHPYYYTKDQIIRKFGDSWEQVIEIQQVPVGSGCVAQVYKGVLSCDCLTSLPQELRAQVDELRQGNGHTGEKLVVAVKILHPNIEQTVFIDLWLLSSFASLAERLIPSLSYLSLTECAKEFSRVMTQQTNLITEAQNLLRFQENFSQSSDIIFPTPIFPFVWRDLLVMSYEDGIPIMALITDDHQTHSTQCTHHVLSDQRTKSLMAQKGLELLMTMIFRHNFVHADLHPGNLAVRISSEEQQEGNLSMLSRLSSVFTYHQNPEAALVVYDCGIVTSLKPDKHQLLHSVFFAIAQRDGSKVGQLFAENSIISDVTDVPSFIRDVSQIVLEATSNQLTLKKVHVGTLIGKLFEVLRFHHVKLDGDFINTMLSVAVLEGLARSLDHDFDLLQILRKFLLSAGSNG